MIKAAHALLLILLLLSGSAWAATAPSISDRMVIDGFSSEFEDDELIFIDTEKDVNGDGVPEVVPQERTDDSKWGFNNDLNQIKITWDADNLYVAVDGISWDNNIILLCKRHV